MPETLETPIVYHGDDNAQASATTPVGNEGVEVVHYEGDNAQTSATTPIQNKWVESIPKVFPSWYINIWILGRSTLGATTYLGFGEQ